MYKRQTVNDKIDAIGIIGIVDDRGIKGKGHITAKAAQANKPAPSSFARIDLIVIGPALHRLRIIRYIGGSLSLIHI